MINSRDLRGGRISHPLPSDSSSKSPSGIGLRKWEVFVDILRYRLVLRFIGLLIGRVDFNQNMLKQPLHCIHLGSCNFRYFIYQVQKKKKNRSFTSLKIVMMGWIDEFYQKHERQVFYGPLQNISKKLPKLFRTT